MTTLYDEGEAFASSGEGDDLLTSEVVASRNDDCSSNDVAVSSDDDFLSNDVAASSDDDFSSNDVAASSSEGEDFLTTSDVVASSSEGEDFEVSNCDKRQYSEIEIGDDVRVRHVGCDSSSSAQELFTNIMGTSAGEEISTAVRGAWSDCSSILRQLQP